MEMSQAALVESMSGFYVVGGNLTPDAGSYIVRPADNELYSALRGGEYAYVLTSRQMGKSSLMHRTAMRLQAAGVRSVLLDLTSIGANLSAEQWYFGLMSEIAGQLDLGDAMDRFWTEHSQQGPLHRFARSLTDVVLAEVAEPLVIFIDEIDFVLALKFSTDEFFASIRRFYNGRATDPAMNRLTFCLLGVATPAYLISDVNTTPFNVGRRIDLTDFTPKEAALLARGFAGSEREARNKLRRILYWTGGHPYLTQKLCLVAAQRDLHHANQIDLLCREIFLAGHARTSEDNLIFVHNKLRSGVEDAAAVLTIYRRVLTGKRVENDPADPVVALLRLSGVVSVVEGRLVRRNRVYSRVFGRRWVIENMPDADRRRERAAYRRGVTLTVGISLVVVLIMGALVYRASTAEREARADHRQVLAALAKAKHMICIQDISLAQAALDGQQFNRAITLLDECRSVPGEHFDQRFEWRWLWHECHPIDRVLPVATQNILALRFARDGRSFVTVSSDKTIAFVDVKSGAVKQRVSLPIEPFVAAISPACDTFALVDARGGSWIYHVQTGRVARMWSGRNAVACVAFSKDGRTIVGGGSRGFITFWSAATGHPVRTLSTAASYINNVAISPNNKYIAGSSDDGILRIWHATGGHLIFEISGVSAYGERLCFSPNGATLAAAGMDGVIRLIDTGHPKSGTRQFAQDAPIVNVAFDAAGSRIVTCSHDLVDRVWRVSDGACLLDFSGHSKTPQEVEFSPDGMTIAAADAGGSVVIAGSYPRAQTELMRGEVADKADVDPGDGRVITEAVICAAAREVTRISGWSATTGARSWTRTLGTNTDRPSGCAVGRGRAVVATARGIMIFDTGTGVMLEDVSAPAGTPMCATSLSGDGRCFAVSIAAQHRLIVYDLGKSHQTADLPVSGTVDFLSFSPDGRYLAGADGMGDFDVWGIPTMKREFAHRVAARASAYNNLCFSSDGTELAYQYAGKIAVYRVSNWTPVSTIDVAPLLPFSMAFTKGGRSIAVGSDDGSVTFWDVASGRETIAVHGHTGVVLCTAFNADGTMLTTVGVDRVIRRWSTE
ncbi:MAG: AAA-like domain-containing protein [Capsulimonadaceae bacterium]